MTRSIAILIAIFALRFGAAAELATPVIVFDGNTNAAPDGRSLLIDVAVLRFLPRDIKVDSTPEISKAKDVEEALAIMTKFGVGDEMYRGFRYLTGFPQQAVQFNSIEHRPAFRYAMNGEKIPYNEFGIDLKLGAVAVANELTLTWDGKYSWSTNFIPKEMWETVMMGVMAAGKVVGAGFKEEDPDDQVGLRRGSGNTVGKDLISVFKKKKKPGLTEVKAKEGAPAGARPASEEPHFIDALRNETHLAGQRPLRPDQLIIAPINPETGSNLEIFYLALRYEWAESN